MKKKKKKNKYRTIVGFDIVNKKKEKKKETMW